MSVTKLTSTDAKNEIFVPSPYTQQQINMNVIRNEQTAAVFLFKMPPKFRFLLSTGSI